jgi:hypothetical protein
VAFHDVNDMLTALTNVLPEPYHCAVTGFRLGALKSLVPLFPSDVNFVRNVSQKAHDWTTRVLSGACVAPYWGTLFYFPMFCTRYRNPNV